MVCFVDTVIALSCPLVYAQRDGQRDALLLQADSVHPPNVVVVSFLAGLDALNALSRQRVGPGLARTGQISGWFSRVVLLLLAFPGTAAVVCCLCTLREVFNSHGTRQASNAFSADLSLSFLGGNGTRRCQRGHDHDAPGAHMGENCHCRSHTQRRLCSLCKSHKTMCSCFRRKCYKPAIAIFWHRAEIGIMFLDATGALAAVQMADGCRFHLMSNAKAVSPIPAHSHPDV